MTSCTVLADAPVEVVLSDGKATSQVQIAKTGAFSDPRYGKFTITLRDFSKWIANFNMFSKGEDRLGLPVDVDHSPERRGDTEAAGWLTSLRIKGNELWATVEWTSLGQELVHDRRYAYLSPSYVGDYKDETGKSHGTALQGVALTNRPFLSMATVSLSAYHRTEEEAVVPSTTQESMREIAIKLGLAEDADEATILAKLSETPEPPKQLTAEDAAKAEGKILLTADQFASLSQNASEGAAAAKQLATMTFESTFATCLSEGKVVPAQKDAFTTMYDVSPEQTLSLMGTLQPIVNMSPVGAGGGTENVALSAQLEKDREDYIAPDADRVRLHERALALELERKIDYGDAVQIAGQEMGIA